MQSLIQRGPHSKHEHYFFSSVYFLILIFPPQNLLNSFYKLLNIFFKVSKTLIYTLVRGGRNVQFHYYDRPFFSDHQNCHFSSSLLHHQNIKSVFLVHHYYYNQNIKSVFLVHHYYNTFDVLILPMVSKKITTLNIKISTTYGVLPMVTKACGGLG